MSLCFLVEGLSEIESLLRAEPEPTVRMPLQFGEVVEQRRFLTLRFGLDRFDRSLPRSRALDNSPGLHAVVRQAFLEHAQIGMIRIGSAAGAEGGMDFEILFDDETPDRQFPLYDHGQRWRLHAAHGKLFIECEGVGPRKIHTDQPVGPASSPCGVGQPIVIGAGTQRFKTFSNGIGCE